MTVISLVQGKGGAGKSTIATNLAVGLPDAALIDADAPQLSSAAWAAVRASEPPVVRPAEDTRQLTRLVEELSRRHPYVLIDAPARLLEMTRAVVILSDLVIVPTAPTMPDLWAVQDTLSVIAEAKKERRGLKAVLLFNRFRPYVKSSVELKGSAGELGIKPMKATLGQRVAYSDAFAEGKGVLEWHDATARAEVAALVAELRRLTK